jgi:N-acetylglucosaminyldiphosphoundecaprenol N-acetyl-beta-D-mannosaminyltransferase
MEASRDPEFRKILDSALLVLPDGMPTVWVGRFQKHREMKRVFGPDFMTEVCSRSATNRYTHFLYGGKPGVAEDLQCCLERQFPGINIVGTFTPPFRPLNTQEQNSLTHKVAALRPDIVWVGLSTPKQERFMAEMMGRLECRLMIGVGAAFDIHTNRISDAPRWVKNAGLQWVHRLCQEPGRLWKRYLVNNSAFLWHLGLQIVGLQRIELNGEPPFS